MTDYTDSLIKNIAVHASPKLSTSLSENLGKLGETLRYARSSLSLASFRQALTDIKTKPETPVAAPPAPVVHHVAGRLTLTIVEARNLSIVDPTKADIYCVLSYKDHAMCTLDQHPAKILEKSPTSPPSPYDMFELAMKASCPKWLYTDHFDVQDNEGVLCISVYDRGNPLPNGNPRPLSMASLKPQLPNKKTVELMFRLQPHPDAKDNQDQVTGEIRAQKLTPDSFEIVRLIGRGSFGKVYQVIKKDSNRIYAMKVLSKRALIAQNEVTHTLSERNVLIQTFSSPFIVSLKYSFQTADDLFLVMDYLPGGELFEYLQRERRLTEEHTRFYAAEIVCALEEIHAHHVVYRDLKPENILMDGQGHLALTDFGLCKELHNTDHTRTFCGTSEYLAPEMVLQQPYGQAVDWWSLGILLYEMLTGLPPFHSSNLETLYRRICKASVKFPSFLSSEAVDIIRRLLDRDPRQRLGAHDVKQVKQHPFFKGIRWDLISKKKVQPPHRPSARQKNRDTKGVFSDDDSDASDISLPSKAINIPSASQKYQRNALSTSIQSAFKGFSYVRDDPAHYDPDTIASLMEDDDEDDEIDVWFK
ncbi:kinase-like domain-containing protein [Radiomyces spectabilis]|uniref:kinase-like domain-containing protein n=1 Tax=Radiomyces spectabilis TaxID=64574 RepID=UPI00221FD4DA|nr:kinase-like domain-containing protein [Radiomyces spectabilis]KAI8376458.1 kinase-like domain-containing protein [Radiomyces spectabilis]